MCFGGLVVWGMGVLVVWCFCGLVFFVVRLLVHSVTGSFGVLVFWCLDVLFILCVRVLVLLMFLEI